MFDTLMQLTTDGTTPRSKASAGKQHTDMQPGAPHAARAVTTLRRRGRRAWSSYAYVIRAPPTRSGARQELLRPAHLGGATTSALRSVGYCGPASEGNCSGATISNFGGEAVDGVPVSPSPSASPSASPLLVKCGWANKPARKWCNNTLAPAHTHTHTTRVCKDCHAHMLQSHTRMRARNNTCMRARTPAGTLPCATET